MKNILLLRWCIAIAISIVVAGCKFDNSTLGLMPESTGRSGEVLLVMDEKMWNGEIGDTVSAWLRQEVLVLPQYEPTFRVIRIKPSAYNDMFQKARNVIVTDVDPSYTKAEFRVETDKFARPQVYITLKAPSDSVLLKSWYNVQNYVLDTITRAEQARFLYGFSKYHDVLVEESIAKRHGIDMLVPTSGFNLDVDSTHFVWISKETQTSSQGILLFDFPYNGPSDFDMQNLVRRMDSVLMLNVPGDAVGSYMAIEKRIEPIKKEYIRNNNYLCELRGLWETEGDFMGGPFVSQSIVDTVDHKLVTAFAYVYGGKGDKKKLLWQLEAIISTFNIHYDAENKVN